MDAKEIARQAELRGKPLVLVVEGVIAAGKSTLVAALAQHCEAAGLRVCHVPEPVGEWEGSGALAAFYADPRGQAYQFQTFVRATRVNAICRALSGRPAGRPGLDLVLLERSPATDGVFMALQAATPLQRAMYEAWAESYRWALPERFLEDAHALYLAPSLPTCMGRLAARGRAGESVSAGYQEALAAAHEAFFARRGEEGGAPYRSVATVPPALAAVDLRAPGPEREAALQEILRVAFPGLAPASEPARSA